MAQDQAQAGKIVQIMGPVVDVAFEEGEELPAIFTALTITNPATDDTEDNLTLEVSLHIGDNTIRGVAIQSRSSLDWGCSGAL